jgi:hypothetical protein
MKTGEARTFPKRPPPTIAKSKLTRSLRNGKHRAKIVLRVNRRLLKIRKRKSKKSVPILPPMTSRKLRWSRSLLRRRSPLRW